MIGGYEMIFGIEITVSDFNRLIGNKWFEKKHNLKRFGKIEERLIIIGKKINSQEEEREIINDVEKLTMQKNGEFSFSSYRCGYYEDTPQIDE